MYISIVSNYMGFFGESEYLATSISTQIRGKIARLIAGKVGLASKIDYFSGEFIGDKLSNDVQLKIKEIEQKYPNPPVKPQTSKGKTPGRGQQKRKKRR